MYYLLAYSISKLFVKDNARECNIIICALILSIPIGILSSAGWISTMNCYLWVAATGLYSLIIVKKTVDDEKINVFDMITSVLASLYACCQEQMAAALFLFYTAIIGYLVFYKKIKLNKRKTIILVNYVIDLIFLVIIATCPGNKTRSIANELYWFPGYSNLSFVYKLTIGVTSMMHYTIEIGRFIFFALVTLIAIKTYKDNRGIIHKIIGYSPFAFTFGFRLSVEMLTHMKKIDVMNSELFTLIKIIVYCAIICFSALSMITIFKGKKSLLALLIATCGFASRYMMLLSPTIYASAERTSYFFYIGIVIICLLIIQELLYSEKTRLKFLKEKN